MLKLIIEDDEGRKTVVPFVRDEITVGRQEGNTIRLTERNVSRRHARLMRNNGKVLVEDLGSYNGIRVNGERITGQVLINDGDLIQIGDYDLAIQSDAQVTATAAPPAAAVGAPPELPATARASGERPTAPLPPVPEPTTTLREAEDSATPATADEPAEAAPEDVQPAPVPVADNKARRQETSVIRVDQIEMAQARRVVDIDAAEAPRLVVLNTELAGREFACIRTELRIGRTEENDIALDHRSLSRTHAKVVREDNGDWRVLDMQSANGLSVNGEAYAQATLRHGDVIELGHVKLKFVGAGHTFHFVPGMADGKKAGLSPVVLVGAVLLVVVGGVVAAYFITQKPSPDDGKKPKVTTRPAQPSERPSQPPETPDEGASSKAENERALAEARAAIERRDFAGAEKLLRECKISSGLCPESVKALEQMKAEADLKRSLDRAEKALSEGHLEEADKLLKLGEHTQLMGKSAGDLRRRLDEAAQARLAAAAAKQPKPTAVVAPPKPEEPEVVRPAAQDPNAAEVKRLVDEAKQLIGAKNLDQARAVLERCVRIDKKAAQCYMYLGATFAKMNDMERGAANYRAYIKLADKDDPYLPKVKGILKDYESGQRPH